MARPKLQMIKAVLGFVGTKDSDLVSRLNAVHDGMFNNPAFPTPPIDMTTFKPAIDSFSASVAAALDGGKSVTALKNKRRGEVILMLHQLGHYVEVACKGDEATFTSSGFERVSPVRTPEQPTDTPELTVEQSGSGQLVVTIKRVAKARQCQLRSAAVPVAGAAINWNTLISLRRNRRRCSPTSPWERHTPSRSGPTESWATPNGVPRSTVRASSPLVES